MGRIQQHVSQKLSREEVKSLRKTFLREPEGIQFFLYDYFSKASRDGRLQSLTFKEVAVEIHLRFPNHKFSEKTFNDYLDVWLKKSSSFAENTTSHSSEN